MSQRGKLPAPNRLLKGFVLLHHAEFISLLNLILTLVEVFLLLLLENAPMVRGLSDVLDR